MKSSLSKFILIPVCLLLFSTQCEEDIPPITQENEQQELSVLKAEIENLARASICGDTFECKFIAFGSKPCGGPWGYLVYSTSIDTEALKKKVDTYNSKEASFNTRWDIVSDCAVANPPVSVNCENNACVAVY
ncbi:MAG: hypothetical protein P8K68_00050 [Algibacter sp.]|uniref:hypothetical protein n=1 Tax=Algibacter sp. TaxID=1872428 RepID=UPI00262A8921|nr:hypothetical protein [Algibacter sp.]MDG1730106.1 hypothetical protein [Algibacter sp.]MDG2177167.1 hypothetical protein [Algibacter sp.]